MKADSPRLTHQSLMVLRVFMEDPKQKLSGAQLMKRVEVKSGTIYPILSRFEAASLLKSDWEGIDPVAEGRPRRRLYQITPQGQNAAQKAFQELGNFGALKWVS